MSSSGQRARMSPFPPSVLIGPDDPPSVVTRAPEGRSGRRAARAAGRTGPERPALEFRLDLARARRVLWIAMTVIVVLDVLASAATALGAPYLLTRFFDGDYKVNFPTGYKIFFLAGVTLLFAALWRVARRDGDRFAPGWLLLTLVSGFACMDETVWLHQSISEFLHHRFDTSGPLKFAWVLVYAPAAAAVFLVLLRYLSFLPSAVRTPMLLGGALYAGGAVLFEPIKSHFSDSAGENSLPFKLVAAASDSSEMIGLTILVVVLLGELARRAGAVAVLLPSADRDQSAG